jgi:hypothetical protein
VSLPVSSETSRHGVPPTGGMVLGYAEANTGPFAVALLANTAPNPGHGKIRTHHCCGPGATPAGIPAVFAVCSAI